MSESLGTATLELDADGSGFSRGLDETKGKAEGVFSGIGSSAAHLAEAIGAIWVVDKMKDFVVEGIQGAESLQKSQEVIASSFGNSAKAVSDFGDSAAKSFGVSAASADATSAKFGLLFNQMGVGQAAAASMTIGWEELAGSLEKVKGVDAATAMDAMTKAAEGNTRGLKDLGITITGHMIAVQAMADGYKGPISAMDTATKTTAIYELATAHLGQTMDEAKAHSGDLADQQRVLSAEWSNAADSLGTALLPALTKVAGFLADNLPGAIAAAKQGFEDIKPTIQAVADFMQDNIPKAIAAVTAAFDYLAPRAEAAWTAVQVAAERVITFYQSSLQPAIQNVITAVEAVWNEFGATIIRVITIAVETTGQVLGDLFSIVTKIVQLISDLIGGRWSQAWSDFKGIVSKAIDAVGALLSAAVNTFLTIAEKIGSEVVRGIVAGLAALASLAGKALDALGGAISKTAGQALGWAEKIGKDIIDGIVNGLAALASKIDAALQAIDGEINKLALEALTWAEAIGVAIIDGIVNGIERTAGNLWSKLSDVAGKAQSLLKGAFKILSPSEAFAEIGDATMQGLALGVDRSSPQALAAFKKTADQVTQAMDANRAEITAAATLLGTQATQGIVNGVAGVQQTLEQQLHTTLVQAIQQKIQEAQQTVKDATSTFSSSFTALAQSAVSAFNNGMTGWVSPAQKILDKQQLQDQAAQYQKAVDDALTKITDDKTAILQDAANGDYAQQVADEQQLLADQAAYHGAVRSQEEFHLQQLAAAQTAAHTQAESLLSAHLSTLLGQLQTSLPAQLGAWVKSHGDILAEGGQFSAANFIQHDSMLSGLLAKVQASLSSHPGEWQKTYDQILAMVTSYEKPLQDAGQTNAEAHRAGFALAHDGTITTVQSLGDDAHDALTAFEPRFFDAGKSLGDMIGEGLAASNAAHAAGQLAQDISNFFPHSPAKVGPLREPLNWTAYITEGLDVRSAIVGKLAGIADAAHLAGSVAVAANIVPRLAGSLAGQGDAGGGGDVVLQVDGETLGRINLKYAQRHARRNGLIPVVAL